MKRSNVQKCTKYVKSYSATELWKKFHEAYNQVRFGGTPITITNHGDDSVVMIRKDIAQAITQIADDVAVESET